MLGNRIQKIYRAAVLAIALTIAAFATQGRCERGRPIIKNGTVLSDVGTLMRGGTILGASGWALNPDAWKRIHDMKLNYVRMDVKTPTAGSVAQQIGALDSIVNLAGKNNLYVGLMNSVNPGSYNLAQLKAFWAAVAPRYKDRTHVLYEMVNEPVSWAPENYSDTAIRDLRIVYDTIRKYAPTTIIGLFDFSHMGNAGNALTCIAKMPGVDWTNTVVAFHGYDYNPTQWSSVMSKYPLFMTEVDNSGTSGSVDSLVISSCEKNKISWVYLHWEGDGGSQLDIAAALIQKVNQMGYTWPMDPVSQSGILGLSSRVFVLPRESRPATLYNLHGQRIRTAASGLVIAVPQGQGDRSANRVVVDKR